MKRDEDRRIGPFLYGLPAQNHTIERLKGAGWCFLHWTDVPDPGLAVMTNGAGETMFVDDHGFAKLGPTYYDDKPVPPDPPDGDEEMPA